MLDLLTGMGENGETQMGWANKMLGSGYIILKHLSSGRYKLMKNQS